MRPSTSETLRAFAAERARAAIITDVWGDCVKVERRGDAIEIVIARDGGRSCLNLDPRNARSLITEITKVLGDA